MEENLNELLNKLIELHSRAEDVLQDAKKHKIENSLTNLFIEIKKLYHEANLDIILMEKDKSEGWELDLPYIEGQRDAFFISLSRIARAIRKGQTK